MKTEEEMKSWGIEFKSSGTAHMEYLKIPIYQVIGINAEIFQYDLTFEEDLRPKDLWCMMVLKGDRWQRKMISNFELENAISPNQILLHHAKDLNSRIDQHNTKDR